jgi:hypothetical protein
MALAPIEVEIFSPYSSIFFFGEFAFGGKIGNGKWVPPLRLAKD